MPSNIRVFLLEDDSDLRSALESVLELEGYEVLSAGDGAEAVSKAAEYPFDIFVFDIKLPGPDGLEVLAQFKKENPELLSVVMTGYATEQDTLRALRLGVGDYLKKPFRSKVLLEAVRRLESEVRRRRALEEREKSARRLLVWLLEFLVGGLEANHDSSGLTLAESASASLKFALGMGHSLDTAESLQAALLLCFLQSEGGDEERLKAIHDMLPDSTLRLSKEIEESLRGQVGSPDSLAALGAHCFGLSASPGKLKELEDMTGVCLQSKVPQKVERRRRQLLSLGRTLAASGEREAAQNAFLKLAEGSRSKETGQAYVELAKLAWGQGDKAGANKHLRTLVGLLPQLGPQAAAELELEAGLTAIGIGLGDGRQLLDRSLPKLKRMGLSEHYGLALLVLRATARSSEPIGPELEQSLQDLAYQGLGGVLLSHSRWLLKELVQLHIESPHDSLRRLLLRLVQDAPRSVSYTLGLSLSEEELALLLDLIDDNGASGQVASLQTLFAGLESKALKARIESIINSVTHQDTPTLRINSLGPFEVWIGDLRLSETLWRTSRSRFLLAHLAGRIGRPVLAEVLIEQFWPGARPDSGKKNLSQTVSDLRKVLSESGFEPADELIVRKHEMISLNADLSLWHDLDSFQAEIKKGQQAFAGGEARMAHEHYRRAYALWRGDYLEDCSMDWVLPQRREIERMGLECCESLATCCAKLELYPEILEVANRVLERDPCHQPFQLKVMEAYSALGRPELALRQFDLAKSALQVELGIEPSTDLLRAQQIAKMAL